MKLAVFGNNYQNEHLEQVHAFLSHLLHVGITVYIHADFATYLTHSGINIDLLQITSQFPSDIDMAVSIGGDGTFLQAADWVGKSQTPIMGINTGHLGYLAGFSFDDEASIDAALAGRYEVSPRMTLKLSSPHIPSDFSPVALNEIAISKGDTTSMVEIRASVGSHFLADYLADGLVISTPTGSTAYNLSCGGPVLQPTLDSIILSPIAPHSLTLRPLVLSSDSLLEFEIHSRGAECHVGVDGRTFVIPSNGTVLKVERCPYVVNVAQPVGADFLSVLRDKLSWGLR